MPTKTTRARGSSRPARTANTDFDLDALENEAEVRPFLFRLKGEQFTFPPATDVDWKTAAKLETGDFDGALRELLGEKQYTRFARHPLSAYKLGQLFRQYQDHQGISPGESQPSTAS